MTRIRKRIGRMRPFFYPQLQQVSIDPSGITDIAAATGIEIQNVTMRIQGAAGSVTISATPGIAAEFMIDGFEVTLIGQSDTNTVTLQDESSLTGSGFVLEDAINKTLGKGDTLKLILNLSEKKWYQSSPLVDN